MKQLYFLTIALLITGTVFAMENFPENRNTIPIVIRTTRTDHTALSEEITRHLTQVEKAIEANDSNTQYNITVNHNAALKDFYKWFTVFDTTTNRAEAQTFLPNIQTLFGCFKELFNDPKVAAIKNYPITRHDVYSLGLHIDNLAEKHKPN